ncbi:MAG: S8 family peptidase [Anaerolineae bacterium]
MNRHGEGAPPWPLWLAGAMVLLALVLLAVLALWEAGTRVAPRPTPTATATPILAPPQGLFVPGELLVRYRAGTPEGTLVAAAQDAGLVYLASLPQAGLLRLGVTPGKETEAIQRLLANPLVEYAGPNYLAFATADPNDPFWPRQWNMVRIGMPEVWGEVLANPGLVIAVLDSGIALQHPDLAPSLVPGYDFVGDDTEPADDFGHGTHVAGIAAAVTNNGVGVAGVAGGARLMPLKVLNASGAGTYFAIVQALYYARDHGARVVNMSLGGKADDPNLRSAVQMARAAGILVVASAGNDGGSLLYPAAYPEVLAVAATDASDQRAGYSNHGVGVDLAAPGGTALQGVYSTLPASGYGWKYGTSMAAPHVSGAAALVWSVAPNLSIDQVEQVLLETCAKVGGLPYPNGRNDYLGYGRLDVSAAIRRARELAGIPTPTPTRPPLPTATFTLTPRPVPTATPSPTPVPPSACAGIVETGRWAIFWGEASTLDGASLPPGTVVEAFDSQGTRCGCAVVSVPGGYGPLLVYGDDPATLQDEGASAGDRLRFRVQGLPARPKGPALPLWEPATAWRQVELEARSRISVTLSLAQGWNLVSFPVQPDNPRPEAVLASVLDRVRLVLTYDCEGGARTFYPDLPPALNTLRTVDPGHGYWVQVVEPVTLTLVGRPTPSDAPIPLCAGWNLVSYLGESPLEVEAALANLAARWDVVLGYEGQGLSYYRTLPPQVNTLHTLRPLRGYWLHVREPGILVYPPVPSS